MTRWMSCAKKITESLAIVWPEEDNHHVYDAEPFWGDLQNNADSNKEMEDKDYYKSMSDDLKVVVNNPEFSDITFTVNGKQYFAHKNILAARSPVFAAMFRSDMKETQTNNVVIDDCSCEEFEVLLNYLYTGDITRAKRMGDQLLPIADKYQILSLKTLCETSIKMECKSIIRVMVMSQRHNTMKLMHRTITFILNNLHTIRTNYKEDWNEFLRLYPDLVDSIFGAIQTVTCKPFK